MTFVKPSFYDKFVCIADKCSDNCCIGWEIDIDKAAMERFEAVEGEFGERLRAAINHSGECPTFANTADERCALLRENGLCELVQNCGEDILCDICALHPRFFEWYNDVKEGGLGLCCEEVCRLLFEDSPPLTFVEEEIDEQPDDDCDPALFELLCKARQELFALLQDREYPLAARLGRCAEYTSFLQYNIDNGIFELPCITASLSLHSDESRAEAVSALLSVLSEGERINALWSDTIDRLVSRSRELSDRLPDFLAANRDTMWQYEHIAVYFLYRYFCKGVFDEEIVSKTGFMCIALTSIALMDCCVWLDKGELTQWDRICSVKLFSKQAEYSDEVREQLCNAVWDNVYLSPSSMGGCLM